MRTVIPIKSISRAKDFANTDGWERMSTLVEPLLSEMVKYYEALGYEVEVRDRQITDGACSTCFDDAKALGKVFGTLYTRRSTKNRPDDELFD